MEKDSNLDEMVKKIQDSILEEEKDLYSAIVIDHAYNPRNIGNIKGADGVGIITGPCGDTLQIYLRIEDNKIVETKFLTDGCGASIACGSVITELVKGKTVGEASKIKSDELLSILDGLPEENVHCTVLSVNTLRSAIENYNLKKCNNEDIRSDNGN